MKYFVIAWILLAGSLASATTIILVWDYPSCTECPAFFRMYKQPECNGTPIALTPTMEYPANWYTDNEVQQGRPYCYYVVAVDATGKESPPSNTYRVHLSDQEIVPPHNLHQAD